MKKNERREEMEISNESAIKSRGGRKKQGIEENGKGGKRPKHRAEAEAEAAEHRDWKVT